MFCTFSIVLLYNRFFAFTLFDHAHNSIRPIIFHLPNQKTLKHQFRHNDDFGKYLLNVTSENDFYKLYVRYDAFFSASKTFLCTLYICVYIFFSNSILLIARNRNSEMDLESFRFYLASNWFDLNFISCVHNTIKFWCICLSVCVYTPIKKTALRFEYITGKLGFRYAPWTFLTNFKSWLYPLCWFFNSGHKR